VEIPRSKQKQATGLGIFRCYSFSLAAMCSLPSPNHWFWLGLRLAGGEPCVPARRNEREAQPEFVGKS